jgi:hypothetical protein
MEERQLVQKFNWDTQIHTLSILIMYLYLYAHDNDWNIRNQNIKVNFPQDQITQKVCHDEDMDGKVAMDLKSRNRAYFLTCLLFPSGFPTKTLYTPLLSPHMLHAPPISFFTI